MPLIARFLPFCATLFMVGTAFAQTPVPGYVPPVVQTQAPDYADDTRGVFVPSHMTYRMKTQGELDQSSSDQRLAQADSTQNDAFEQELNRIAGETPAPQPAAPMAAAPAAPAGGYAPQQTIAQQGSYPYGYNGATRGGYGTVPPAGTNNIIQGDTFTQAPASGGMSGGNGVQIAGTQASKQTLDVTNTIVRLREDRISIRRVLQRMLDQAGASDWTVLWDLSEQNRALPDMEISIDADEPFINVLNALLARMQTRSGMPLKVIRYDNTHKLVITDRASSQDQVVSPIGVPTDQNPVVTEDVLKESMVSLHYDEIPLVDALESIVNQAGKGQWRLRIYAGLDQVLKPAHIEEPFSVAMERLLRLFNLKYEVFPGGKLVVVTQNNHFGFPTNR